MHRLDPHSHYDATQPRARRLRLKLGVDFKTKRIDGEVVLVFGNAVSGPLDLDSKGLEIRSVQVPGQGPIPWELGDMDAILGQRLRLDLPAGTEEVAIAYCTAADAMALQWLDPQQTEGKVAPFLFSQCQQIHARTMVPCQDTPFVRIAYQAEVTVPEGLTAVMSAGPTGDEGAAGGRHVFRFSMPQPIPSYLLALAVGRLEARDLSPRARVWAEPEMVESAAWEFAGLVLRAILAMATAGALASVFVPAACYFHFHLWAEPRRKGRLTWRSGSGPASVIWTASPDRCVRSTTGCCARRSPIKRRSSKTTTVRLARSIVGITCVRCPSTGTECSSSTR